MLNYMSDVQQRGQRWKSNRTFSARALWHWVEWCRAFGTLALWSMARRDWGKVNRCICRSLPCRPFFAVAELPDWLARACIRPFRHAEKISQSQGVISSISIIILPLVPFPITSPLPHCWQKDWTTEPHTATYTMSGVLLWWRHFLWHSSKHWLWHAKAQMRDSRWFVASFQIYNLIVAKVFWLKIHDIAWYCWILGCCLLIPEGLVLGLAIVGHLFASSWDNKRDDNENIKISTSSFHMQ